MSNIFDILELMFIDLIESFLSLDLRKYLFIFIVRLKPPSNNRFLRVTYLALHLPNLPPRVLWFWQILIFHIE